MYSEGISKAGGVLDLGVEMGLIEKRGSFYTYGELRIGQGRENAKQYLKDNPDLAEEIELAIRGQAQQSGIRSLGADAEQGAEERQVEPAAKAAA
jgi:recombination protein RecA